MKNQARRVSTAGTAALALALLAPVANASVVFDGKIAWIEVWATGNVAFTLNPPATGYCNSQFIVNFSWNGSKNLVATLLSAKAQDKPIRIHSTVDSTGCITAEGYGGTYVRPDYVYMIE